MDCISATVRTRGSFWGAFTTTVRRGPGLSLLMWCRNGFQPPRRPGDCQVISNSPTSTPWRT
jgi:hypothetical protein